jgi:hypothetical protein
MKKLYTLSVVLLALSAFGQRIKKETVTFTYIQPPVVTTLGDQPYQSTTIIDYKADIDREEAAAEAEFQEAMANYPSVEAAAKAAYDQVYAEYEKALADWNNKSLAGKFIEKQLLENQKPVAPSPYYPPAKPVKRSVYHQYLFDADVVNQSFASLKGRNRAEGGISIELHMHGYEAQAATVETKESNVYDTKTKQTRKEYKSQYVMMQKHPISAIVKDASGNVLFSGMVAGTEEYMKYESGFVAGSSPSMPGKETMEKALGESNLKLVSEWLNNQYGIVPVRKEITIRNPENKKVDYGDFLEAYYTAQEGYEKLENEEERGIEKLQVSIALWTTALSELDLDNKKARINKKVAPDLYLNLIEACIFAHEFETAEELISATRRLDFAKRDMDDIAALKEFLEDFRVRF